MKPHASGISVESNVSGESVGMTIDAAATQHIMGILTNMYEDAEAAVIREYTTNAWDAQVAAGVTTPIEVSTPTSLRPSFTVQDRGTGMSADDIRRIYSRYGASTKRSSDDATGMLGIGCKSALAYVDQFTLTSVKDGRKVVVSVSRSEDGAGSMTIVSDEPTTEPNGTLVTIPVRGKNEFATKCADFFRFWPEGRAKVDGEPTKHLPDSYKVDDRFYVLQRTHTGYYRYHRTSYDLERAYVVMGNVAYPANIDNDLPANRSLVAHVPIGTVQFAPSREGLLDTPVTRRACETVAADFRKASAGAADRILAKAQTRGQALTAMSALEDALGIWPSGAAWRGDELPRDVRCVDGKTLYHITKARAYQPANEHSELASVGVALAAKSTWITEWDNANWTKANRDKLTAYAKGQGIDGPDDSDYLLTRADTVPHADTWLAEVRTFTWDTVRKWRDPNAATKQKGNGVGTYAGTYPGWDKDGGYSEKLPAANLDPSLPIFYHEYPWSNMMEELREHFPKAQLVRVTTPRQAKFLRLFPKARAARDGINEKHEAWAKALTADQRKALATFGQNGHGRDSDRDLLAALKPKEIDDPVVAEAARIARVWTQELQRAYNNNRNVQVGAKLPLGLDKYPLASERRYGVGLTKLARHVTIYINAAYAASQKENA